jgi:hypothetical protein
VFSTATVVVKVGVPAESTVLAHRYLGDNGLKYSSVDGT